jgi:hypothetical protein
MLETVRDKGAPTAERTGFRLVSGDRFSVYARSQGIYDFLFVRPCARLEGGEFEC